MKTKKENKWTPPSNMGILNQNEIDTLLGKLDNVSNKKSKEKVRKPTGKMDKETFIIIMNFIIEQDKMNMRLDSSLSTINSSWTITEPDKHIRKALWKMLEIFFSDAEISDINWYLYENVPKIIYELDKKTGKHTIEHKINNTSDLYDYIINWRKKK
jgi:hypothetical protein